MADTLKERKIYRVLTNVSNKAWDKIAFWTTAKSVDAADGKNLQTKIGAINGITSDVSGTATDVAASIKVVNTLNKSLVSNVYVGTDGKLRVTKGGADTVLNFSSANIVNQLFCVNTSLSNSTQNLCQIDNTYVQGVGYNNYRKLSSYKYIYYSLGIGFGLYDTGVNGADLSNYCGVMSVESFVNGKEIHAHDGGYWCKVKYKSNTHIIVNSALDSQRFFLMIGIG